MVLRVVSIPVFVLACYQFRWDGFRAFSTDMLQSLMSALGSPVERLSETAFFTSGQHFRMAIACTALDAYFGSIPLLWETRWSMTRAVAFFATYFATLSVVNLLRLALGFVLYARGYTWAAIHEIPAGFFYFALFLWICKRRRWI